MNGLLYLTKTEQAFEENCIKSTNLIEKSRKSLKKLEKIFK